MKILWVDKVELKSIYLKYEEDKIKAIDLFKMRAYMDSETARDQDMSKM